MESINSMDDNIDSAKQKKESPSWDVSIQDNPEKEKINDEKMQAKESQNSQANLLSYILNISDDIKKDDFDIKIENNSPVIFAKSTYFASLVGLNWKEEKEKCLNNKISRKIYDEFDNKIKNIWEQPSEKEKNELIALCKNNWVNFNNIIMNWWCVVEYNNDYCVWIKNTPIISKLNDNNDRIEWTISHESQHIKFNKYCEENHIEPNWHIKILNEVIAHCCNTKDKSWNIDFDWIKKSMKNNKNYIDVSWFSKRKYKRILSKEINKAKSSLKSDDLDTTMKKLIDYYKKKR